MKGKIYLGGRIVAPEDAKISVFDRGFLYGDSVYETARVYEGVPFALEQHLDRFEDSARRIAFVLPWPREFLRQAIRETVSTANLAEAYLRVIATRGSGTLGLEPQLAVDPLLVIMALEYFPVKPEVYQRGRSAQVVVSRRGANGATDPRAKTGNYMTNVLAAGAAREEGADEAIMLDEEGRITEGSSANLFAWIDGFWCTPPTEVGILEGITRAVILAICQESAVAATERVLFLDDLTRAGEVFLCSSMREIVPLTRINGHPVGDGEVGPRTRDLLLMYRRKVRASTRSW